MLSSTSGAKWQFWIDRGGTFTDIVARRPDGGLATAKLLSENPGHYADAAVESMRRLLGLAPGQPITGTDVESVKMGARVATNALLERKGERTVLATTRGFADALRIACPNRPRLFDRQIVLSEMLYELSNAGRHVAAGGGGGQAGAPGINRVERADGRIEPLDYIGSVEMQPGDVFVIETPGGGWREVPR